jgi:hypothetical protein
MAAKKSGGRKYGKKASEKVEEAMHERKHGTLRSGSGKKVTRRKQAIAIGLSEARRDGGKVPAKKTSAGSSKRKAAKSPAKKKSGARKPAKSPAKKKSGARKPARRSTKSSKRKN